MLKALIFKWVSQEWHSIKLVFFIPILAESCHVLGYNMLDLPAPT